MLQKGHGFVLWGHSIHEAYMLAFLLNRACEVQIASLSGGVKPYVPPQSVLDITLQQAGIITNGEAPFNKVTWQALLRGEPVEVTRLDGDWARRLYKGDPHDLEEAA